MQRTGGIVPRVACWQLWRRSCPAAGGGARPIDAPTAAAPALFEEKIHPVLAGTAFAAMAIRKWPANCASTRARRCWPAVIRARRSFLASRRKACWSKRSERADDVSAMPPDKPLRPDQVADFAAWIKAGAPWPAAARAIRRQQALGLTSRYATPAVPVVQRHRPGRATTSTASCSQRWKRPASANRDGRGSAHAHPPRDVRSDRLAADARRRRRVRARHVAGRL